MREVIIVFGPMGAGKTVYAKNLAKEFGYEYICFDDAFSRMFGGKFEPFFNYLITKIEVEKKNVVLDGWFVWDEEEVRSVKRMEAVAEVTWVYLFAPKWVLEDRIKNKEFDVRGSLDLSIERTSPDKVRCKIIDTIDFEYEECSREEYEKKVSEDTKETVKQLLKEIRGQEPYQNIRLPFGLTTSGYTDCERSWDCIRPLVDWKGKTVLDIGAHWGFFCFETKREGAKEVVGLDISEDSIKIARKIRNMKKINVVFRRRDIEFDEIEKEYDVILLLNTLHHLRSPFHVLRKIFSKGKTIILEVELPHDQNLKGPVVEMGEPIKLSGGKMGGHLRFSKEMLTRFAAEHGHILIKEVPSCRPNRTILMFQRD